MQHHLSGLEQAIEIEDHHKIRDIFLNTVAGYNPEGEIVDSMYLQQKNKSKESRSNNQ